MIVVYFSNIDFACTVWCKRATRIKAKGSGTKKTSQARRAQLADRSGNLNGAGFFERFPSLQNLTAVHPI